MLPEVEDDRSKVELDEEERVANKDLATPSSATQPSSDAASSSSPPFPPEVFLDILMSDLGSANLAACALVCRELFPLARQCLYRSIPIHAVSAVASMRRDIITRRYWLQRKSGRLWPRLLEDRDLLSLVSLPGVTTLTISTLYPETAASLPSLTSLVTRFLFHPYSPGKVIADDIVAPRRLKHLVFYLHKHQNPVLSQFNWMLSGSRHTLTSLHVPFDFWAPTDSERVPFHPSFLGFSALRSLTLRTDEYLREPPAGSRPSAYPAYPPTLQSLMFDLCTYETIPPLYGLPTDPSFPAFIESLFLCPGVIEPAAMLRLLGDGSELLRLGTLDVYRVRKEWEETDVDSKGEEGEKRSALEVLRELCSARGVELVI
ncbi:hypothetical protein JCM8097_001413 [Rhodosporidiobolus ruineniae]